MSSLKGTQTEKNLLKAFAGESQARNRYTFFAKQAAKEGYEQIAALFLETAENEGQHAKMYFRHLEGGIVEITAAYPAGKIGTTAENLLAAADGENEEWTDLYPAFADMAESEGLQGRREVVPPDRQGRGLARGALPQAARQHREGRRVREARAGEVDLPQVRLRPRRPQGAQGLPGMRPSAGLPRGLRRELLRDGGEPRRSSQGSPSLPPARSTPVRRARRR